MKSLRRTGDRTLRRDRLPSRWTVIVRGRASPAALMAAATFALLILSGCAALSRSAATTASLEAPPAASAAQRALIGDYGEEGAALIVLESGGHLWLRRGQGNLPLAPTEHPDRFDSPAGSVRFERDAAGRALALTLDDKSHARIARGPEDGSSFRIEAQLPVDALRSAALAAHPPLEQGDFRPAELVELSKLDPSIRLDVRYASDNNFLGLPVYAQARAFLQRPAAEALLRAGRRLAGRGYGLMVFDGYRPWYVTRMFWDATPPAQRIYVADPARGSRHNRGCAVDLSLYELASGLPVEMTGGYDEMTPRSFPDYPGGSARQRWHRDLLREAMEAEGFSVYETEWWHFDYFDWPRYRIGTQRFEEL